MQSTAQQDGHPRDEQHRHAVLVVEDYDDLRDGMMMYLDLVGFETRGAASGANALALLAQGFRPCVVLLDLCLPGMDGRGVWGAIHARPDTADIPVIMVSGDSTIVVGPDEGIAGVLSKPCDPDDLVAAITTHARCGPSRLRASGAAPSSSSI